MESMITPDCIDGAALRELGKKGVCIWCNEHFNELVSIVSERMTQVISERTPIKPPQHVAEYCPINCRKARAAAKYGRVIFSPLGALIFCASYYPSQSSHSLLFGKPMAVSLMPREKALLNYMELLPEGKIEHLLQYMEDHELHINNPSYVLQRRIRDVASFHGLNLHGVLKFYGISPSLILAVRKYANELPAPITDDASDGWSVGTQGLRLAFLISTIYNVSLDYLVLLDYSRFAVVNGLPLSAVQQEFLSAFLRASPEAQEEVIFHLINKGKYLQ